MNDALSWGNPLVLWWLWGVLPLWAILHWKTKERKAIIVALQLQSSKQNYNLNMLCFLFALGFMIVALAQPRWGFERQKVSQQGRDIIVVLDASRSMWAQDVAPSRMEQARRELIDLSHELQGDRVGLVLFAAGAYPRMPLSRDYRVFRQLVRDSDPKMLRGQGSRLSSALGLALRLFDEEAASHRAILVVSDGETSNADIESAAQQALQKKVPVYCLGVGTDKGGVIPIPDGGFVKDGTGSLVQSKKNAAVLQKIARVTNGAYVNSVPGKADIQALYTAGLRKNLTGKKQVEREERLWNEMYQWPLGIGIFMLLLSILPRISWSRMATVMVLFGVVSWASPVTADDGLHHQYLQDPNDLSLAESYALQLLEVGQANDAMRIFRDVARRSRDQEQHKRALYNAGIAAYRSGRLVESVGVFEQLLTRHPEHENSRYNIQLIKAEIERRREQQKQSQSSNQQTSQDSTEQAGEAQSVQEQSSSGQDAQQEQSTATKQQPATQMQEGTPSPEQQKQSSSEQSLKQQPLSQEPSKPFDLDGLSESAVSLDGDTKPTLSPVEQQKKAAERTLESVQEGRPQLLYGEASKGQQTW